MVSLSRSSLKQGQMIIGYQGRILTNFSQKLSRKLHLIFGCQMANFSKHLASQSTNSNFFDGIVIILEHILLKNIVKLMWFVIKSYPPFN